MTWQNQPTNHKWPVLNPFQKKQVCIIDQPLGKRYKLRTVKPIIVKEQTNG